MGSTTFDVFLSHNSRDKGTVERIAVKLKQAGLEPWLDVWSLTPGGRWQEEIAAGLAASCACAIFVGPTGIGDWMREELAIAKDRAAKQREFRLFPVLLPGLPEPFDGSALPPFLNTHTWVDLRDGFEDPARFQPLINAIKGIPLGPRAAIAPREDVSPYRGLETFDETHAEFFFGREGDVQRLLEHLKGERFLAVVGPSGSGKSSLVRAGLIPALRNGRIPGSERWSIATLRPGAHPLTALAAELVRLAPAQPMQATLDGLERDPRSLHLATELSLAGQPADTRVVWVIDQFEETFTLCRDESERTAFLENLLYAAAIPGGRCLVILAMRADFYPHCAAHAELAARIGTSQYLVGPLSPEGVRQAIVEPAWRVGLSFEDGLVDTILGDVATEPGGLPLLAHALLELWERRRGQMLSLDAYRATGGVTGALAKRADDVYAAFDPAEQAQARRILLRLTQPGEGTEDTRRHSSLGELVTRPEEQDTVSAVVDALVAARLLTTSADETTGEPGGDVAHEALIRSWPRLRGWLDEDRAGLRTHRRLTEAAQEWDRLERDPDLLYRGSRLNEAQGLAARDADALNPREREFLAESAALRERELAAAEERRQAQERLRRRIMAGMAAFSLLALLLAAFAGWQWWEAGQQRRDAQAQAAAASEQRDIADAERRRALSSLLAQQSQDVRAGAFDTRLLLSLEANRLDPEGVDARGSLLSLLQSNPNFLGFLPGHQSAAVDAAISPDGSLLAVAGDAGITLWDVQRWQRVGDPIDPERPVNLVQFTPDGRLLAGAGQVDGRIVFYDPDSGQHVKEIAAGEAGTVMSLAFSPDGQTVATIVENGSLTLLDAVTGEEHSQPAVPDPTWATFSPDGRFLAVATYGGSVLLAKPDGTDIQVLPRSYLPGSTVNSLSFSPDSRLLAAGTSAAGLEPGAVVVWNVDSKERIGPPVTVDEGHTWIVAFTPNGRWIVVATWDGSIYRWRAADLQPAGEPLRAHPGPIFDLVISPDGRRMVSVGHRGTAVVWDIAPGVGTRRLTLEVPSVSWNDVEFSPDGRELIGISTGLQFRSVADPAQVSRGDTWLGTSHKLIEIAVSAMIGKGAALDKKGNLVFWNLSSLRALTDPIRAKAGVLVFSPDGKFLVTGGWGRRAIRIWDTSSYEVTKEWSLAGRPEVYALAISSDSRHLVIGTARGVLLWDLKATSPASTGLADNSMRQAFSVAISPDGKTLAVGETGGVRLIDVLSRQQIAELPAPSGGIVRFVAFSPDGAIIAIGGDGDDVTLFDVATRQRLGTLNGHGGEVWPIHFSPDGRRLVALGWDLLLWNLDPIAWEAMACALAGRNLTFEEWTQFLGDEPYRKTCPDLPGPDEPAAMTAPLWATPSPSAGATPVAPGTL
jgi:WD40 repeat protein